MINQFGGAFTGHMNPVGLIFAVAILAVMIYMLFIKKYQESTTLTEKLRTQGS
jgi:ferrous iron transport protein B